MDCSPPGFSVYGIFQAKLLECGAIAFSGWATGEAQIGYSVVQSLSRVQLFATSWAAAHQASLPFTISQSMLKLNYTSILKNNKLIWKKKKS